MFNALTESRFLFGTSHRSIPFRDGDAEILVDASEIRRLQDSQQETR